MGSPAQGKGGARGHTGPGGVGNSRGHAMAREQQDDPATSLVPDMDADGFRRYGYRVIDWIADYIAHGERYPVLSRVVPGAIKAQLPARPPDDPEPMAQ